MTVRALLLVDLQNDFMPFGALPVVDGDAVVPIANALAPRFSLVVASQGILTITAASPRHTPEPSPAM